MTKHYYLNQNTNHTSFCYQLVDNNGAGASLFMEGTAGGYVDLIDVTSTSGRKVIVDLFCYREA